MLAFAAYQDLQPLAVWPENIQSRAYCLYLADAGGRPIERAFDTDFGRLACYCPEGVWRRLYLRYPVRHFGDPILRTRLLFSGPALHNLAVELALGRLELLDEQMALAEQAGLTTAPELLAALRQARALTTEAQARDAAGERADAAARADDALAISVPLGEELAGTWAAQRLAARAEQGGLRGVLLGCTGGDYRPDTPAGPRFLAAFNYATLPFYLSGMEPAPGQVEHAGVMCAAERLKAHGFMLKGHPLVWTYTPCLPPHRRGMDFATCCEVFHLRIMRDVPPFAHLIDYWDIINEAHDTPWANSFGFTSRQMVELTALAARATRQAAPRAKLVVNVCLPFGEYAAGAPGRATPLEYLQACLDAGVDFDVIGIQFYYGGGLLQYCWDMLEISRLLDQYVALGKEIHIAELGTPSAMGADPAAMITESNEVGVWHQAWTPETQAEWIAQFYTLCLSKPSITALTYWGFSDATPKFWPHSGLLDAHDDAKPAYLRLMALKERWLRE